MIDIIVRNKYLIIGLAVMVGVAAWYTLRDTPSTTGLLATEDFSGSTSEADRDLVATLLQLRAVSLDGAIFQEPAFRGLRDFGIQIVPEPVGRSNPFAPLPPTSAEANPQNSQEPL